MVVNAAAAQSFEKGGTAAARVCRRLPKFAYGDRANHLSCKNKELKRMRSAAIIIIIFLYNNRIKFMMLHILNCLHCLNILRFPPRFTVMGLLCSVRLPHSTSTAHTVTTT